MYFKFSKSVISFFNLIDLYSSLTTSLYKTPSILSLDISINSPSLVCKVAFILLFLHRFLTSSDILMSLSKRIDLTLGITFFKNSSS